MVYRVLHLAMVLTFLCSCSSDDGGTRASSTSPTPTPSAGDTTSPVVGAISFSNVDYSSMDITWTAASDDVTTATSLSYKLVKASDKTLIDTISEAEAVTGSDLLVDWQTNVLTYSLSGLAQTTTYAFAVLVKDAAGNKAIYTAKDQTTPTQPSVTNLISHWKFDNSFLDEEGLTNFTPVNSPTFSTSKAKFGTHSAYFNGVDQYLSTNYDFSGMSNFTMAGWVYVESVPALTLNNRIGFWGQNDLIEMGLMYNSGFTGYRLCLWVSGSSNTCDTVDFPIGQWVHVTIMGSTTMGTSVYKNGQLIASSSNTNAGSSGYKLSVGNGVWNPAASGGNELYFHGFIDELAMWDRLLNSTEIQNLANQ